MADRGPLNLNINHTHTMGGADNTNDMSSRLSQVEAQISKLSSAMEKSIGSNAQLISSLKSIPVATEAIAVAAAKMVAGTKVKYESDISQKNRDIQYSKSANKTVGEVDSLRSGWGDNLTPTQSKIVKLRDVVDSHIDAAGNFSSTTKEATQGLSQLNQSLKSLNKTVAPGTNSGGINGFNVAEALTYATALSAGKYANLGAAYDVNIQGASANQLGSMTVQKDIAQRNAFSSGVTSGGAALGAVIGGVIGGPVGGIVGSALGASLGVISSGFSSLMNAHEIQAFTMQSASNMATTFGGKGGKYLVTPKAGILDKLNYYFNPFLKTNSQNAGDYGLSYYVSDPHAATFLNKGQGYNALESTGLTSSGNSLYGINGNKSQHLAKALGTMVANSPNLDLSSMLGNINYLAAITPGNSLADNLYNTATKRSNLGKFTGGNLGGFLGNVANLAQLTPMSAGSAFNFEASVTPHGPAYTSAANGLQTMPVFQQMQAAAMLSITNPGTTLSAIQKNPSLLRTTAKHMNLNMFGENFDVFEGLRQTAVGASTAQAIDNDKITNANIDQAPGEISTPTAVQSGLNAANKTNAQHVTIQTQNVSIMSHGTNKYDGNAAEMQATMTQLNALAKAVSQGYA